MYLLTIVSAGFLASCSKEDVSTDLTNASSDALVLDYTTDASTQLAADELLAASDINAKSSFDFTAVNSFERGGGKHKGKIKHPNGMKGDSIPFTDLPTAAQTYINTNLGGVDSVKFVLKITLPDSTVEYSVRLTNGKHVHFDANGNIITKPKDNFETVAFADLPTAVQTYLNANVDVTKIAQITKRTAPDGTTIYIVRLTDNTRVALDANGNVVTKPTDTKTVITFADLPTAVQTYLNANTTVANITEVAKVTRPDGKILYVITFSDGKRIALTENGTVVKGKGKHH